MVREAIKPNRARVMVWKYVYMLVGFAVISIGIDLQRAAGVGLPSYGVLHQGISLRSLLSFGQASIVVSLICIVLSAILGVKPRLATVLNMLLIGVLVDWFYPLVNFLPTLTGVWMYLMLFTAGTALVAWGIAMYISVNLGSGPRDSLMLALVDKTKQRVGIVVTGIESIVLVLGYLLGGPVGWGTIISAVAMGWFVEGGLKFFQWLSRIDKLKQVIETEVSVGHGN